MFSPKLAGLRCLRRSFLRFRICCLNDLIDALASLIFVGRSSAVSEVSAFIVFNASLDFCRRSLSRSRSLSIRSFAFSTASLFLSSSSLLPAAGSRRKNFLR